LLKSDYTYTVTALALDERRTFE